MVSHEEHYSEGVVPPLYMKTFIALLVLAALTILAYFIPFPGALGFFIAMVIASVKAAVVVLYFMHVIEAEPLDKLFAAGGLAWLALLLVLTLADYFTRPPL